MIERAEGRGSLHVSRPQTHVKTGSGLGRARLTGKWKGHFPKSDGLISILLSPTERRSPETQIGFTPLPRCPPLPACFFFHGILHVAGGASERRRLPNPLLETFIAPSCRQKERSGEMWRARP